MLVIADQAWNFIILWIRVCSLDEICLRFVCLKGLQVERVANDSLHSLHLTTRARPYLQLGGNFVFPSKRILVQMRANKANKVSILAH